MSWFKLSNVLHILASTVQAAHNELPQDSQQKQAVGAALQEVHDIASELASTADNHGGSLDHATLVQTITEIATPILAQLAEQAFAAAMAKFAAHTAQAGSAGG